jgi:alginate O-acetyltransferase complex protein AlgI
VLIANTVAGVADKIFALPGDALRPDLAWLGVVCYTVQIYFDFSGYTDMAIGIGAMFGFTFPENFNYPYVSTSIREFWRRWHMTLSSWLRDYLYIPLGGSRCAPWRVYFNLVLVFFCVDYGTVGIGRSSSGVRCRDCFSCWNGSPATETFRDRSGTCTRCL